LERKDALEIRNVYNYNIITQIPIDYKNNVIYITKIGLFHVLHDTHSSHAEKPRNAQLGGKVVEIFDSRKCHPCARHFTAKKEKSVARILKK